MIRTTVPWGLAPTTGGSGNPILTQSIGGFAADGVIVVSFTVPATPATYASGGSTQVGEYNGPPTFRQITLSRSPCDFRPVDATGAAGPFVQGPAGLTPSVSWFVGQPPVNLVPGETYYVNIRNWYDSIGITCSVSQCNAIITFHWPS